MGTEETYLDNLDPDKFGNFEDVVVGVTGNTEEPGDGVANISNDQLDGQRWVVDVEVSAPPGHETRDQGNSGQDTEESCHDHTSDLDTEPGTVGEGVEGVGSAVLVVIGNDHTAGGQSLLGLWVTEFGDCKRSRDRHDTGGNHGLRVQTKGDVGNEDGSGDGGETAAHNLMEFGLGHVRHERSDQHSRFTLTDEGGCSSHDGLRTGDTEGPEKEGRELHDEPLEETDVVEELDKGHEEDDGWDNTGDEPVKVEDGFCGEESSADTCKSEKVGGTLGDEGKDVVTCFGAEHEDRDDELTKHTSNDWVPVDGAAGARRSPENEEDDCNSEQGDCTIGTGVVGGFLGNESTDEEDSDGDSGSSWSS